MGYVYLYGKSNLVEKATNQNDATRNRCKLLPVFVHQEACD